MQRQYSISTSDILFPYVHQWLLIMYFILSIFYFIYFFLRLKHAFFRARMFSLIWLNFKLLSIIFLCTLFSWNLLSISCNLLLPENNQGSFYYSYPATSYFSKHSDVSVFIENRALLLNYQCASWYKVIY